MSLKQRVKPILLICMVTLFGSMMGGCIKIDANPDTYEINDTNTTLSVFTNDSWSFPDDLYFRSVEISFTQPACGEAYMRPSYIIRLQVIKTKTADSEKCGKLGMPDECLSMDYLYNGLAAGVYYFDYQLKACGWGGQGEQVCDISAPARVTLNVPQTILPTDGSAPCGATTAFLAFISKASSDTDGITVEWYVPTGAQIADSYRIKVINGDVGSDNPVLYTYESVTHDQVGVVNVTTLSPVGNTSTLWVTLEVIKDGNVVHSETVKGIPGYDPFIWFITLDDNIILYKGITNTATVDVLANNTFPPTYSTTDAQIAIVNDGGITAFISGQMVEIDASSVPAGDYAVELDITIDTSTKKEYLYVHVLDPATVKPVANDDFFIGLADETVDLNVLANDTSPISSPLSINSFTQPTGTAVTQSGNLLQIVGPAGGYTFTYTATDENGIVSEDAAVNVTLAASTADAVDVTDVVPGIESMTVYWRAPADFNATGDYQTKGYILYYQAGASATKSSSKINNAWRGLNKYTVTGLTGGTEYCFGVTQWKRVLREGAIGKQMCATPTPTPTPIASPTPL